MDNNKETINKKFIMEEDRSAIKEYIRTSAEKENLHFLGIPDLTKYPIKKILKEIRKRNKEVNKYIEMIKQFALALKNVELSINKLKEKFETTLIYNDEGIIDLNLKIIKGREIFFQLCRDYFQAEERFVAFLFKVHLDGLNKEILDYFKKLSEKERIEIEELRKFFI